MKKKKRKKKRILIKTSKKRKDRIVKSELRVYRTAQQRRTDNRDRLTLVEKEDDNGPENANAIRLILNLIFFSPFTLCAF